MSRMHPEFLKTDPSDCWVSAGVLVREEPDDEDDDQEEEDDGTEDDNGEANPDEGYSE